MAKTVGYILEGILSHPLRMSSGGDQSEAFAEAGESQAVALLLLLLIQLPLSPVFPK